VKLVTPSVTPSTRDASLTACHCIARRCPVEIRLNPIKRCGACSAIEDAAPDVLKTLGLADRLAAIRKK
jgi:hypothetical protein